MDPGLPHGSSPWADGPRDDNWVGEGPLAPMIQFVEQVLNGVQFGVMLFLMAAGLTLVFSIMNLINLAHGSLYMVGAYFASTFVAWTGSFVAGAATGVKGRGVRRGQRRAPAGTPHSSRCTQPSRARIATRAPC